MRFPQHRGERAARREQMRSAVFAQAERDAQLRGRSIRCGEYGDHAPGGCGNDGSGCICECHDPKELTW